MEHGTLQSAAEAAVNRRVLVLVSGLDAVCIQTSLPVKSAARLTQMLPYSLEDVVAEDVDRVHFAAGSRDASGSIPVVMAARRQMTAWLEDCARAGLDPERIYSESEGVPIVPGCLVLVFEGNRIHGRAPGQAPFTLQGLTPPEILQLVHGDEGGATEPAHVILYTDTDGHPRCENDVAWLREQGVSLDVQLLREGLLPRLGATLISHPGSNLLQGAFSRRPGWQSWLRPWRFAAALLLATLVLAIAGEGTRYLALTREERSLTAMLETACQRSARSSDLVACESEIRRRLTPDGTVANGTGFLVALDAVARAWNQDTRVEALSFRSGVMDLRIVASDVSSLDAFAREVGSSASLQASIQSANPTEDGILGRLQIELGP